jgi:hypothetical protein
MVLRLLHALKQGDQEVTQPIQSTRLLTAVRVTLGHTLAMSLACKPLDSEGHLFGSIHNLCFSAVLLGFPDSRWMRRVGHVVCMGKLRNVYKTFTGKPERKKTSWNT